MSWYLNTHNSAPNDDDDPEQPSGPSAMPWPAGSPDVSTSDFNSSWNPHMRAEGLQPQQPGSSRQSSSLVVEHYSATPVLHGRVELTHQFACIECYAVFQNNNQLWEHGKSTGHRPYSCDCGKTYSKLYALTRHLSVTNGVGAKYSCPLCTKYDGENGFNRRDHLQQHLRELHKLDKKGMEFIMNYIGPSALAPAEAVNDAADAVMQNNPMYIG
ncbi:hypothetical protein F4679DRAFT_586270 [Xylaria curta]|nr:hypothetical protein F4679DRAFT_586270 [Xylaria curta]